MKYNLPFPETSSPILPKSLLDNISLAFASSLILSLGKHFPFSKDGRPPGQLKAINSHLFSADSFAFIVSKNNCHALMWLHAMSLERVFSKRKKLITRWKYKNTNYDYMLEVQKNAYSPKWDTTTALRISTQPGCSWPPFGKKSTWPIGSHNPKPSVNTCANLKTNVRQRQVKWIAKM